MFDQDKDARTSTDNDSSEEDYYDAELLDEMTTNRGELKCRTVNQNDSRSSNRSSLTYGFNEDRHIQVKHK
jgi:boron transporter